MYVFSGRVIKGEGRGREIGFPSANLDNLSLPLNHGVYLVSLQINGSQKKYQGLLHFGQKKTFNNLISTEIYIDNFNSNIYNKKIEVVVLKRIRGIKKFRNVDGLIKQINQDKKYLRSRKMNSRPYKKPLAFLK